MKTEFYLNKDLLITLDTYIILPNFSDVVLDEKCYTVVCSLFYPKLELVKVELIQKEIHFAVN